MVVEPEKSTTATVPFTRALGALAVAPLAGTAILAAPALMAGPAFLFALLYVAPFAYGAAAVFVLPVLIVWPAARRLSYPIAVVWGTFVAYAALLFLASLQVGGLSVHASVLDAAAAIIWTAVPGGLSGMLYVWLVRRRDAE
jgi:hypothetical protein